jgi:hypothetical protein
MHPRRPIIDAAVRVASRARDRAKRPAIGHKERGDPEQRRGRGVGDDRRDAERRDERRRHGNVSDDAEEC